MALIYKEVLIKASASLVWDAVRDVGAVHTRLAPGVVDDTQLEEGARTVTFANGMVVRELIVDICDERRRLAYASVGGQTTHHNSSIQVFPDGDTSARLVWITDVLPNDLAGPIGSLVELGSAAMKCTLEGLADHGRQLHPAERDAP
ncbi:MAG: SRPBCC family protein [Sterolibacterium sp.]|jgi:hypothetical protein